MLQIEVDPEAREFYEEAAAAAASLAVCIDLFAVSEEVSHSKQDATGCAAHYRFEQVISSIGAICTW
jgi:hypothetical protein